MVIAVFGLLSEQALADYIVKKDGTGDFTTIQADAKRETRSRRGRRMRRAFRKQRQNDQARLLDFGVPTVVSNSEGYPITVTEVPKYGGGSGQPNDPYLIYTADQMNAIGTDTNDWDEHFLLTADIDLAAYTGTSFNIIGNDVNAFTGVFDGNDHTISNFTYSSTGMDYIGIFGYINSSNAEIKDLELIDPNVDGGTGSAIGCIVGYLESGAIKDCRVLGGTVKGGGSFFNGGVGGVLGFNNGGVVRNCHFSGSAIASGGFVGGIAGFHQSGVISDCSASGTVSKNGSAGTYGPVGGLAGISFSEIVYCTSNCSVTSNYRQVGGLVGDLSSTASVFYCTSSGTVSGTSSVGGLIGRIQHGTVSYSYSNAEVAGTGWDIGGLVGNSDSADEIFNCYATGSVSGGQRVGGLVGLSTGLNGPGVVSKCYSTGNVSGDGTIGGLVGANGSSGTITNCFWDIETSGLTNMCGSQYDGASGCNNGNGKTTTQMRSENTFTLAGWDVENTWAICDGYDYPYLRWEGYPPCLDISTNTLTFTAISRDVNPDDQTFTIVNSCAGILNWSIDKPAECGWLNVSPLSNNSNPDVNEVILSIDVNQVDYGFYSCQLIVSDPNATNSPQIVTVNFEVLSPVISVVPGSFYFEVQEGGADPNTQILSIQNTGYDTLYWQIDIPGDCNWLSVDIPQGENTGETDIVVFTAEATGKTEGFYNCNVTISDPNADNNPVILPVMLHIRIPDQIITVDDDGPADFNNIQAAIDVAFDSYTILVKDGRYTGTGNREIDFLGKAITVRSENGPNDCIIDCNGEPDYRASEHYFAFNFQNEEGPNSVIQGLTITKGRGITTRQFFPAASPTITDCNIVGNYSIAISNCDGPITNCVIKDTNRIPNEWPHPGYGLAGCDGIISNCVITGNKSSGLMGCDGKVIDCTISNSKNEAGLYRCDAEIINCTITGNSRGGLDNCPNSITDCVISNNSADWGGGLRDCDGPITNCTITENIANGNGGGLYQCNGPIIGCNISNNTAWQFGGGLSRCDGPITNCNISNNYAVYGGGLEECPNSITNCTITKNIAEDSAGGLGNCWGTISNCKISGNSAGEDGGGAMHCTGTIKNCIISGNKAGDDGGGLNSCWGTVVNNVIIGNKAGIHFSGVISTLPINCIIWNNVSPGFPQIPPDEPLPSYSCIQDWIGGGIGNINSDPCFADPGYWDDNDTPVDTNDDFWVDGDYHLKSQIGRWKPSIYLDLDPTGDNFINMSDFSALADFWWDEGIGLSADLDDSGFVDLFDLQLLLDNYLAEYPPGEWVTDDISSPCIDAGDPNSDWTAELWPNGERINMGAYGGTPRASMSPAIGSEIDLDNLWMYQSLPGQVNSDLTASVLVTEDPLGNSSYSYEWEFILPSDVNIASAIVAGGGSGDAFCTFAAPGCRPSGNTEPNVGVFGVSDSGQAFKVRVTITGDDYGNTAVAEAEFGIALLGDVNNDGVVDVADLSITNAFWKTGSAGAFTLRDCDVNCDDVVDVADRSITNAIWRGTLGQNSVSNPCPLR